MAPTTRSATSIRPRPQYAVSTEPADEDDDDAINNLVANDEDEDEDPTYDLDRDEKGLLSPLRVVRSSKNTRRPNRSFHFFPQLPPELRVMIWKMALQLGNPRARGIQYFTIFQTSGERKSPLLDLSVSKIDRPPTDVPRKKAAEVPDPFNFALGAPRVITPPTKKATASTQYSWFSGNPSLYSRAAGVQFACWESRVVAMKSIEAKKAEAEEAGQVRVDYLTNGVQCKVQHNEATILLDVSRRDVFCFSFEQEDMEAMNNIKWEKISRHSMFNHWRGLDRVAFEFDVSWLTNLPTDDEPYTLHEEMSPRGFFARVFDAWCRWKMDQQSTLLLIDRNIKVEAKRFEDYHPDYFWRDQEDRYAVVHRGDVPKGREKKEMMAASAFAFVEWMKRRKKEMRRRNNPLLVMACLPRDG